MFGTRSLALEWSRTGIVYGLLRATATLPQGDALTLQVSIDGQAAWQGAVQPEADGRLRINLHTHLLADGRRDVRIVVRDAAGRAHEGTATVDVRNGGGLADTVREALRAHATPLVFLGDCDASYYAQAPRQLASWVDAPDAGSRIADMLAAGTIDAVEADMLARFARDGFVVLNQRLPEAILQRADADLDHAIADGYQGYRYGDSTRLEQMHATYPGVRDIWLHEPIHRFLSLVFGAPSQPCQSLVYVFGSQQDAHQDTIHLTPFPAGMMCGVWVALEDVREGSGELMVYPGSHKLPRVYMQDVGAAKVRSGDWREFGDKVVGRWSQLLAEAGTPPQPYLARRGDILIWHENLMHAGSVRRDLSLSRRSVVTHNFAQGAIVYYDSTGDIGHVHDRLAG